MASGGRQSPLKRNRPNSEVSSNSNSICDGGPTWTLVPNNLELNAKSKASKKQRNKDKSIPPVKTSVASHACLEPCSNKLSARNLPRTKLTTATWLKDQQGTGITKRNQTAVADEVALDIDHPAANRRNTNVPMNQRPHSTVYKDMPGSSRRTAKENENTTACKEECTKKQPDTSIIHERLNHLKECIGQVSSLLAQLEQSDEPTAEEEKRDLQGMMKVLTDELSDHNLFLRQHSSSSYSNCEETTNKQNHLSELHSKMKASQEKLTALKQQQSLLMSMQKDAEDKLAAFQAQFTKSSPEESLNDQDWEYLSPRQANPSSQSTGDDSTVNADASWDNETYSDSQVPTWVVPSPEKSEKARQRNLLSWKEEPQDLTQLHVSLDNITKRVEILQQISDNKNLGEPPNTEDLDVDISERVAAVEWQRKKLKNKLVELQEKKKANDELIKELSLLKQVTSSVIKNDDEDVSNCVASNSRNHQQSNSSDESTRNLDDLRETLNHLRGWLNTKSSRSSQDNRPGNDRNEVTSVNFTSNSHNDSSAAQHLFHSAPPKRDNLRKEQNSGFPARRHYEAEGRANEDSDIPTAAVASPSPEPDEWDNDPRIQERIRELQNTEQKLQMMQALMSLMEEAKQANRRIPSEYLQLLSAIKKMEEEEFNEDETVTDNDDRNSAAEMKTRDASTSVPDEVNGDTRSSQIQLAENTKHEQTEENLLDIQNLEHLIHERERLMKLHEKFVELQKKFPSSSQWQNNEHVRSSGEGGSMLKKKSKAMYTSSSNKNLHLRPLQQDNLLTRQNIATMESQNETNSTVSSRENVSIKNDNINNLSAKLTKHSHGTSQSASDSAARYNTDFSSFSANINKVMSLQSRFPADEQNKHQNYSRNRDNHCSNSSVNSEPLDGSNSALAPDTTVAATWGGSSTQENFEDENEEPIESIEDQEDEDEASNNEGLQERIPEDEVSITRILNAYPNRDSPTQPSVNRRDNRLHKYFKSTQLNQWSPRKNFAKVQASSQRLQPNIEATHSANVIVQETSSTQEDVSRVPSVSTEANSNIGISNFAQQLQQQLEQLNALCQPLLQDSSTQPGRPSLPMNDLMSHYTQQLQLQQHLLLSLSQCYHTLYIQQLEIQHLQRCLQQNADTEGAVPAVNPMPPSSGAVEDFTFRPWFLSPWPNAAIPTVSYPPSQISPMSAPPFLQTAQPPAFTYNPAAVTPTASTPCALVTGMQPARAVVHPAAQDTRTNTETLNNQIPPRTRANNFWDNFRSYSRQNLLSTSNNNRSKESTTIPGTPQVRQVHPLISNGSSWSHRSRVFIPPHTENSNMPAFQTADKLLVRPVANPEFQEMATKSKKPNSTRQQILNANQTAPEVPRRSLPSFTASNSGDHIPKFNSEQSHNTESRSCIQLRPVVSNAHNQQSETQSASKSCFLPSTTSNPAYTLQPGTVHSEVSRLISQNDTQSRFLMELLQEVRNLGSDSLRQRALTAVREMVQSEISVGQASSAVADKNKNDEQECHQKPQDKHLQHAENIQENSNTFSTAASSADVNNSVSESSSQWNNQSWPAATIIPLGKFRNTKPSTGAVMKKKPVGKSVHTCTSALDFMPTTDPSNTNDQTVQLAAKGKIESFDNLIEKVILNVLPYIHDHIMDDCCSSLCANLSSKITKTLSENSSIEFSSGFLQQLQKTLNRTLAKYSGMKWCECEPDLLKSIADVLFKELSAYSSIPQRQTTDEHQQCTASASGINAQPDLLLPFGKPVSEKKRGRMVPSKESKEDQVQVVVCNNSSLNGSVLQESQDLISELFINMPSDENAALPVNFNALPSCPTQPGTAEEDMGYECGPEAEAEPEVEAGTEADLAEADQSPGQQGATATTDTWHIDSTVPVSAGHIENFYSDIGAAATAAENSADLVIAEQDIENKASVEISLDDIPTKLMPLTKEELLKQMAEEQESNSLLAEVIDDVTLVGNGDSPKEPTPYL